MLGTYVKYKGRPYIVVGVTYNQYKLNSLKHGRVKINISNAELMKCDPAVIVEYKQNVYLVTKQDHIFSVTTGRFVKWTRDSGNRRAVLYLAGQLPGYSKP